MSEPIKKKAKFHWEGGTLVFDGPIPTFADEHGLTRLDVEVKIIDLPLVVDESILEHE